MALPASRHHTVACARCGRAAAEIALLPASAAGERPWHQRDRLERTDFLATVTRFGDTAENLRLFEAICRSDYASARAADPDFVGFVCRECNLPYCDTCWHVGAPEFDEGFYDCTRGTCPAGHEQVVDD